MFFRRTIAVLRPLKPAPTITTFIRVLRVSACILQFDRRCRYLSESKVRIAWVCHEAELGVYYRFQKVTGSASLIVTLQYHISSRKSLGLKGSKISGWSSILVSYTHPDL